MIFQQNMHQLYKLSFLLTASHVPAEECFVQSLDDSAEGDRIFPPGAESRVSWIIARNAIRITRPLPGDSLKGWSSGYNDVPEFAAVIGLPAFERFVFVLSVLERFTDQESARLLNCSVGDVVSARVNSLQSIARHDAEQSLFKKFDPC
jgi:hypothetical protein